VCTGGTQYWHAAISQALQPQVKGGTEWFGQDCAAEERERPEPNCSAADFDELGALHRFVDEAPIVEGRPRLVRRSMSKPGSFEHILHAPLER
jgi:hypothetical protein